MLNLKQAVGLIPNSLEYYLQEPPLWRFICLPVGPKHLDVMKVPYSISFLLPILDSLVVLEFRRPKLISLGPNQSVIRATLLPETPGESSFLASFCFWWLLTFLALWPHHSNIQGQYLEFSVSSPHLFLLCVCQIFHYFPHIRIPVIICRSQPNNPGKYLHLKTLNLITPTKTFFFAILGDSHTF